MKKTHYLFASILYIVTVTGAYGQSWNFLEKVVQPKRIANDVFSQSVAIEGDYTMIGCWRDNYDQTGGGIFLKKQDRFIYNKNRQKGYGH